VTTRINLHNATHWSRSSVSECVNLYSALSLRTLNALDALISHEQVRFKQTLKTVCAAR